MATVLKRGSVWYVKYYDAAGAQKWVKGYTDKGKTKELATRLENEKTAIRNGDLDPKQERRKVERNKLIDPQIAEYETYLRAAGNTDNHIDYTIKDIRKFVAFSKPPCAESIKRQDVDAWVIMLREKDAPRTVNRRVGSLQAFLRKLHETGGVPVQVGDVAGVRETVRRVSGKDDGAGQAAPLVTAEPGQVHRELRVGAGRDVVVSAIVGFNDRIGDRILVVAVGGRAEFKRGVTPLPTVVLTGEARGHHPDRGRRVQRDSHCLHRREGTT